MSKVNIANYVIYDLANRFNFAEYSDIDNEIVGMVAESWHKKHFVSDCKNIKHNHDNHIYKKIII